jgi:hypothetical protein
MVGKNGVFELEVIFGPRNDILTFMMLFWPLKDILSLIIPLKTSK